ncbi:DNA-directed RNA polymerase III subunit RPC7 [Microcaecilia unicolor]|uniref:DNA-directed RNA polymerase III subunit n=1 Tax=Microcaecilia unicolor TaxID=1415580 RepID=A0A6P7X7G7_9AMPH|nr:DNA-directed RNA polymerase III subunit RPC7 [Microcaecilia unicolor]XP_030049240.1 DNA-directed RNA polymerase III subunit RPC7 [Microcaecilia unicolor]XP_030049241.1 DNA-directed RNA polymerase III subunit RPC7 [Microcaecilia unicolor]
MSATSKGRGRAAFTFDIQAIGFSRGDALPESVSQPSPVFPNTDYKPVPLKIGDDEDYMLALKQELRGTMKRMPYFIAAEGEIQAIEKYSFKYKTERDKKLVTEWIPDWRRLPREMKPRKKKKLKVVKQKKTNIPAARSNVDVLKKIEELEKKGDAEKSDEETEEKEKKEDEEEAEEEADAYDEEEQEEENDYISSYFEDGDEFGEGSDDNMDEATY